MKTIWARALVLSLLVTGTMAFSIAAASMNASAAGVAGTWVSRIPGEGYTETYLGFGGEMLTDSYDVKLVLSGPDSAITGTLTTTDMWGYTDTYPVDGTFDGTTFLMTAYYNWDGVNYVSPTYALAVSGSEMYGSATFLNTGVTVYGTFDLEKEGFSIVGVGGVNTMVSAIGLAIAAAAIVVAISPVKGAKGTQQGAVAAPYTQQPVPSQQRTTGMYPQPQAPGPGTPIGGVGLHYPNERPLSGPERGALKRMTRSPKVNAVGLAIMSMAMAVMVNFVAEPVALIMPLFFGAMSLGVAFQARGISSSVARALDRGTAAEWRYAPSLKSGIWDFGAFSFNRSGQAKGLVAEGSLTTVTLVPEAKRVLAVNGTMLSKPMELRGAPGFPQNLAAAQTVAPAQAPAWRAPATPAQADDLPPPPDGWGARFCPKCGEPISGDYAFCRKCGFRLKA